MMAPAPTAAREFAPDVIFLDIGLPVMNGYAVARTLRGMPEFNRRPYCCRDRMGAGRGSSQSREPDATATSRSLSIRAMLEDLLATIAQRMVSGGDESGLPRTRRGDSGFVF